MSSDDKKEVTFDEEDGSREEGAKEEGNDGGDQPKEEEK